MHSRYILIDSALPWRWQEAMVFFSHDVLFSPGVHENERYSAIPGEYLFPLFLPFLEEQRTIFSQPPHEKGECNT
jgi:hypothetical protein